MSTRLHDLLHRIPGVPAHATAEERHLRARQRAARIGQHHLQGHPQHRGQGRHPYREPRLLKGWQSWIGARLGQQPE